MPLISEHAKIGKHVKIGDNTKIYNNVIIGDNSIIGDNCIIGHPASGELHDMPLIIGKESLVRSHTILYEGSCFGDALQVGHQSLLREGIIAGKNLQVGSFNDLEGDCKIGDFVRFHSNVHVGRGSNIGNLVWLYPYVVLTNDPLPPSGLKEGVTLKDGVVVCTSSVILPNSTLEEGVFVAAMSRAGGHVPIGSLVIGAKGQIIGSIRKLNHKESKKHHPWMNHYSWAYPEEAQVMISKLKYKIETYLDHMEHEPCVS